MYWRRIRLANCSKSRKSCGLILVSFVTGVGMNLRPFDSTLTWLSVNWWFDTFLRNFSFVSLSLEESQKSRASGEAASSARGGRRAKRETAMVSYDCEARHSGDGVILLVDDDAQLSAIFISDMRGEFEPCFAVLEIKESTTR